MIASRNILILVSGLLLVLGCNRTIEPDLDAFGRTYFPLKTGRFIEYSIQEVSIDGVNEADTLNYMLKEVVVDSFYTQAGQLRYIIHSFKRESDEEEWQLDKVLQQYLDNNVAVRINGNIPVIKLTLPVSEGAVWDMNRLNTLNESLVMYDSVSSMFISSNGTLFDETATIVKSNNQDLIVQQDLRYEIFAKNVGLVREVSVLLNYCLETDCFGQQVIEDGRIYNKEYHHHGIE